VAITYVGKGAAESGDSIFPPTPDLPAGLQLHDLAVAFFYSEDTVDQTVAISEGWTQLYNERTSGGLAGAWYRFIQDGDEAPTFTIGPEFTAGSSLAQIAAWRSVDPADAVEFVGSLATTGPSGDVGPIGGIPYPANGLVLLLAGKLGDIGHSSSPTPGGLTWVGVDEADPPPGGISLQWWYAIAGGSPDTLADQTAIFGDSASTRGRGAMVSFNAGTGFHPALAANYRRRR